MRVVLPTYRSIGWIVPAYATLHEAFWGVPVDLLAEEDYSRGRLRYQPVHTSIPQAGGEVHSRNFSDVLIAYLQRIPDDFVLLMLADYLLRRPVNTEKLARLEEYMVGHPEVLRGHVGDDGCHPARQTDAANGLEIWEGNFLPTSLTPGLWNRKLLLEMLHPENTGWDVEKHGQDCFLRRAWRSVAVSRGTAGEGIMAYVNALRGRDMTRVLMTADQQRRVGACVPAHIQTDIVE